MASASSASPATRPYPYGINPLLALISFLRALVIQAATASTIINNLACRYSPFSANEIPFKIEPGQNLSFFSLLYSPAHHPKPSTHGSISSKIPHAFPKPRLIKYDVSQREHLKSIRLYGRV